MIGNFQNIEFELYEYLYNLKSILSNYEIESKLIFDINEYMNLIKTKKYNVAVVGEFKRGKSSLINALLGMKILPADVTPTTATINRITYGVNPEIELLYKSGASERKSINTLSEYVTKTTKEQERTALLIKEAVVYYPIVICQNHVDIIDTPGLNDDEVMTEVTVGMLENIDAAIVVISALIPFSETEKNLVANLIASKEINHIIFVVSFIDQINEEDQPKLVNAIKNRIHDTVPFIESKYSGKPDVVEKAYRILKNIDIFAISSSQALESFVKNDTKLLKRSHFQEFKQDLYKILTAKQSVNVVEKVAHVIAFSNDGLGAWFKQKEDGLCDGISCAKKAVKDINGYFDGGLICLNNLLVKSYNEVAQYLDMNELNQQLRGIYISNLSKLRVNTDQAIRDAISIADKSCGSAITDFAKKVREHLNKDFIDRIMEYSKTRNESFVIPVGSFLPEMKSEKEFQDELINQVDQTNFPVSSWNGSMLPDQISLVGVNVIAYVNLNLEKSSLNYKESLNSYIAAFRKILFTSFHIEKEMYHQRLNSIIQEKLKQSETNLIVLRENYRTHKNELNLLVKKSSDLLNNLYEN